jgi:methylated-DNA-protein-cysteine methyltransferase-like protein
VNDSDDKTAERQVSPLYRKIWEMVSRIPRGKVATYGQIAALAGQPGQARLVGYALHRLPEGSKVPWQRVVNSRGEISLRARSLVSGAEAHQRWMLEQEGVTFDRLGRIDLKRHGWKPRRNQYERRSGGDWL